MPTERIVKSRVSTAFALTLAVCPSLGILVTGCHVMKSAADMPADAIRSMKLGKWTNVEVDPVEVQNELLRFAEEFFTRIAIGTDGLRRGTNAIDPAEVLQWKIMLSTLTINIATGPSLVADLLDMTVFVTVMRDTLETHWMPGVFGESARGLMYGCREAETNIWRLTNAVLRREQQDELRKAIDQWARDNPLPKSVLTSRTLGFASEIAKTSKSNQQGAESSGRTRN